MSAETSEMLSNMAQLHAARDSEHEAMNAVRLDNWKRRYWYRCIEVPAPRDPPKWPAIRASLPIPNNVTPLTRAKKRGG